MVEAASEPGIVAVGFYVPRYVISAEEYRKAVGNFAAPGIEAKAVPGFDEDAVTMAVEAGERALSAGNQRVERLVFLSTTSQDASTVAQALGIGGDLAEQPASPVAALSAALGHAEEGHATLLIASDAPIASREEVGDHALGAAAVALLIAPTGPIVRADGPSHAVGLAADPKVLVGDTGIALPFLRFLESLRTADVEAQATLPLESVAFRVTAKPTGDLDIGEALAVRIPVSHEQYIAMRYHEPPAGTEYSQGAYVSPSAYLGEAKARYRLVAERCAKCGRVHFPPRESCGACGATEWEDVPLSRDGTVYAYTIIGKGAAPSEFLEQQNALGAYATAIVELRDGPRVAAMLTDVEPKDVRIGMPVRMVFRRLYTQEGVARYGFKFVPVT